LSLVAGKLTIGFGFDFDSLRSEDQPLASTYRHLFQPNVAASLSVLLGYYFPLLKLLPLPPNVALEKARKTIKDIALSMIHLKQDEGFDKEGHGQRDIVGVMIKENRKNRENGLPDDALTEDEMVNQVMTFLAAGYITRNPVLLTYVVMRRHHHL
jgi:cytochrome P450